MNAISTRLLRPTAIFAIFLLAALPAAAQRKSGDAPPPASGKPRVLVIGTGSSATSWTTNVTTATLEDALSQSGRFDLITAAQRDKLIAEQGFNNSDLVDPKQATRVGKLLSARYIIIGNVLDVTTAKRKAPRGSFGRVLGRTGINVNEELSTEVEGKVQLQMIDAETGVVKLSKSYEEKSSKGALTKERSEDEARREGYREVMEKIASQFVAEIGSSVPVEGLVVLVRGNRVAIDLGSNHSVRVGQEFEVYTEDEPIKNAAGEVLSYVSTKYARLRVESVEPKLSWLSIIATYDENGTPDAQIKPERIKVNYAVRQILNGR